MCNDISMDSSTAPPVPPIQPAPAIPPTPSVSPPQTQILPRPLPLLGKKRILIIAVIIASILIVSLVFFIVRSAKRAASISGVIDLNGHILPESTIALAERKIGESQYNIVVEGIKSTDQIPWAWKNAQKGSLYEIKAYLRIKGNIVAESESKFLPAPAANEVLTINSQNTPVTPATVTISGKLDLNGSIPPGSIIAITQRISGNAQFHIVVNNLPAVDGTTWSWDGAVAGNSYDIEAMLKQGDITLAESAIKTITAPAANEVLRINAVTIIPSASPTPQTSENLNISPTPYPTYTPYPTNYPTPTSTPSSATISGSIDLNGVVPNGAILAIYERRLGASQFNTVIDGISAQDGAIWNWNDAQPGVAYELKADLKANGNIINESASKIIAAPAANEILTINVGTNLSKPPTSPGVQCNQSNSNNNWNVNISYHSVNDTQQYWIKAGDINQDNRFIDTRIPPNNQSLPTTYNFNTDYFFSQGVTYFVKYAYSSCSNCTDIFYFSPFSASTQFSCNPPGPTNTPSPTPTITPTPKPTKTPTPLPSPTITIEPSPTSTPPLLPTETPVPTNTPPPVPTD